MKNLSALALGILAFFADAADLDEALLKAIENDRSRWVAHSRGAEAKEAFRVVDGEGCPVTNAIVRCAFRIGGAAGWQEVHGITDTNGCCAVIGMSKAYMDYLVDKDGYYQSHGKVDYMNSHSVPAVVDGKWQPYGETRTVVLKKIRDPWGVKVFNEQCHRRAIPAFGRWMGFDLENGDWTSPYGSGHVEDVLLRFKADVRKHRIDYTYVMDVCFTNNPYAGAYLGKKDRGSDLMSEYVADTNASYQAEFSFVTDSVKDERVKSNYLDQDSYLVFRTRTRVDDEGRLVGAHYGKIYGIWRSTHQRMYLNDGCFNPKENDTNIEGDQELLYKIKNCRKER